MGDVAEEINNYGTSPDRVLALLQDALADERQYRRLLLAAIEQLQSRIDFMNDKISSWLLLLSLGVLVIMLVLLAMLVLVLVIS